MRIRFELGKLDPDPYCFYKLCLQMRIYFEQGKLDPDLHKLLVKVLRIGQTLFNLQQGLDSLGECKNNLNKFQICKHCRCRTGYLRGTYYFF